MRRPLQLNAYDGDRAPSIVGQPYWLEENGDAPRGLAAAALHTNEATVLDAANRQGFGACLLRHAWAELWPIGTEVN